MSEKKIVYSVIIPVYNAEKSLDELLDRLAHVLANIGEPYEIILINDASMDRSWEVIKKLKETYPQLRAFNLMFNVGQFKALMCGFENARGDLTITMDDDLQNPPEEIPKLIKAIHQRPEMDCIIGIPKEKKHGLYRRIGSWLFHQINNVILDKPKTLKMSSFRIFRRHIREGLIQHKTRNPIITPLILKNTQCVANIAVNHNKRKHGHSGYSHLRLIRTTFDNIINISTLPLKMISGIGILASLCSMCLMVFYLFRYFTGMISVPGWITLISVLTFFLGLILFSIGLIGEYLLRIVNEVNHSPRYTIREKL